MLQKFPQGTRVYVSNYMPDCMSHFERDFIGIVEYTYAQEYGGENFDSYSIIQLDNNNHPINSTSWYYTCLLTLHPLSDCRKGKKIISKWRTTCQRKRQSKKH
jgi:hypothetical protein